MCRAIRIRTPTPRPTRTSVRAVLCCFSCCLLFDGATRSRRRESSQCPAPSAHLALGGQHFICSGPQPCATRRSRASSVASPRRARGRHGIVNDLSQQPAGQGRAGQGRAGQGRAQCVHVHTHTSLLMASILIPPHWITLHLGVTHRREFFHPGPA